MEIKTNKQENKVLVKPIQTDMISSVIEENAKKTNDVKTTIDLVATKTALSQEETVDKIVAEKTEELKNDAEAKRVQAETEKIRQEVDKVRQEGEKVIAELEKEKKTLEAEIGQMQKEADKANAYYNANKDILKCVGIHSPKTLGVMKGWMYPATIIFAILQIIKLPITICGALFEGIIDIVGGVCGSVKNNALKIIVSIVVILLITAAIVGTIFGGRALVQLFNK